MFSLQTDEQLKLRHFILPELAASDEYLSGVWGFMTATDPDGLRYTGEWNGGTWSPPVQKTEALLIFLFISDFVCAGLRPEHEHLKQRRFFLCHLPSQNRKQFSLC